MLLKINFSLKMKSIKKIVIKDNPDAEKDSKRVVAEITKEDGKDIILIKVGENVEVKITK